jgi:hypothetical protein
LPDGRDRLAARLVGDRALHHQQRALARPLVDHVKDAMRRNDRAGCRRQPMQRQMLLAMHGHAVIDAGVVIAQQERLEAEHDRKGRQHLQVFLIDESEFARIERVLREADAERVEHHVLLGIAPLAVGESQPQQPVGVYCHVAITGTPRSGETR